MSLVFPTSVRLYASPTGTWTDISQYAVSDFDGFVGFGDNPIDMLANTGELKFELDNRNNLFSPEHDSRMVGFQEGTPIKLVVTFDSEENVLFIGRVKYLSFDNEIGDKARAYVTAADWMDDAFNHKIVNVGVQADKRADELISFVNSDMDVQPASQNLQQGNETFETVLDISTSETTTYAELQRATASEVGYTYLKKDGTLVFENSTFRNGLRQLPQYQKYTQEFIALLREEGDFLLQENEQPLLIEENIDAIFENSMVKLELEYGKEVTNYITEWAYPREISASPIILWKLNQPISIKGGGIVTIKGNYTDPTGGNQINGQDFITPVVDTDYKAWTGKNGTGVDISHYLVLLSEDDGSEGFTHILTNTGSAQGWITQYKFRGNGIYTYNTLENYSISSGSIAQRGIKSDSLVQKYQRDTVVGKLWGDAYVDYHKTPRTEVKRAVFIANTNSSLMKAFLRLDVGDLVRIKQTLRNIDGLFYIQGVSYSISLGGMIMFKWSLKLVLTLALGLTQVGVEFTGHGSQDAVDFGYIPKLADLDQRSYSFWMKADAPLVSGSAYQIVSMETGAKGFYISYGADNQFIYLTQCGTSDIGIWATFNGSAPRNTLLHVVVTRDVTNPSNLPVFYINNSLQAMYTSNPQTTPTASEVGLNLMLGNLKNNSQNYTTPMDGKIFNFRIYNRILNYSDVDTLYRAGYADKDNVLDGLLFRVFSVRTKELSSFSDHTLTDEMKLIDDIGGIVGTPHGSPIARTAP